MSLTAKKWSICIGLILMTLIAYSGIKDHSFVSYDDDVYVTSNPHVQSGLNPSTIAWAFTTVDAANWHPLTWLSHIIDYQLHGLSAPGHLFTNLLLHASAVVLLFLSLCSMTGALWRSATVAALFAVHPLNVESVAWVAERKNVLSTMLLLATLLAYAWYSRSPGIKRYSLVAGLFALGLMAKPMLVTLPFALLLLDYWPLGRLSIGKQPEVESKPQRPQKRGKTVVKADVFPSRSSKSLLIEKIPLLLLAVCSSAITFIAQSRGGAVASMQRFPISMRINNAIVSYIVYLRKTVWPSDLAVFYPHQLSGIPLWQTAVCLALLAILTAGAILVARRQRYVVVGWFWYLGTLVPVIGLVQVGYQSMADRYAYVPLIGIFVALVWGLSNAATHLKINSSTLAVAAVVPIAIFALVTRVQLEYWTNSILLFSHAVAVTEQNYVAQNNLGEELAKQGKTAEASEHFEAAIAANPAFDKAHLNQGMALVTQGKLTDAIDQFDKAIEISPQMIEGYSRKGAALASSGRTSEAIESFAKALEINPDYAPALANMGFALDQLGRDDEAIDALKRALGLRMQWDLTAQVHYALARVLTRKGESAEANSHYREAVRLKPDLGGGPSSRSSVQSRSE